MTSAEAANLSTIRTYLNALEAGAVGEALARFFTPDAVQVELPNRLNPRGRSERLTYPSHACRAGSGPLALESGSSLRAHFAMFFEFKDGLISSQRNYDCFEPW